MKYILTLEGLFDHFKSDKNWYLKLELNKDGSAKTYDYKGIKLVLQGYVATKKSKVDPLLDIIYAVSKHWNLVDNKVDLLSIPPSSPVNSITDSISSEQHRLEFRISDTKEVDPNMPDDIAKEIIEYVDNKFRIKSLDNIDVNTYVNKNHALELSSRCKENKLIRIVNQRKGWITYIVYIKF